MKLRLILAYDGRRYCGWQAQDNATSVQSVMTKACSELYGTRCLVTGCSRTDSGVHARGYSCAVAFENDKGGDITCRIPAESVPRALNARLPEDISVLSAECVPDGFHPRYDVKSKTYEYLFYDAPVRSPFYEGFALRIQPLSDTELAAMDGAARKMEGRRDFSAFMASGSKVTDTVRNVTECRVARRGELIVFSVTADGFLYKMVRTMAGTALDAARGKLTACDIDEIIRSRQRARAGATLPPSGLYLCRVEY